VALVWRRYRHGQRYEVRSAGRTLRLYTNGVCHTEYNPARAVTGSLWDLLFLPALFAPPAAIRRVLVLGVGGGSVVHLLRRHIRPAEIVGVELSAMHLAIGRRWFGLDDSATELHEAEASDWVRSYAGPRFDLIVDDLFLEEGDRPLRAVEADAAWLRSLLGLLAPHWLIAINVPD